MSGMIHDNIKHGAVKANRRRTMRLVPLLGVAGLGCMGLRRGAHQPPPTPPDTPPVPAQSVPLPARPRDTPLERAKRVHDPCIIRDGAFFYVFATGGGIPILRSRDLRRWEPVGSVFGQGLPEWTRLAIPGCRGAWAPDISFSNGRFQLYYAVSRFGSNRSLIGLASSKTLDPASPDYGWRDDGKVLESGPTTDYNAIDPNLIRLAPDPIATNAPTSSRPAKSPAPNHPASTTIAGVGHPAPARAALAFGSFFSGIKLVFVDAQTGKPAPDARVYSLAQRPSPDAVEAPFVIRRGAYYYLFVSFDFCCRGVNSTYNIRVGRGRDVTGPYVDRDGKPLMASGGSPVLAAQGREIGPGHCAVLQDATLPAEPGKAATSAQDYLVYHYYDRDANGASRLQIRPLAWTPDGWPLTGDPLIPSSEPQESKPAGTRQQ